MTSETPNKTTTTVPPTPSAPLPSSSFTTPDKFKIIAQRQIQRLQEINTPLHSVPEDPTEPDNSKENSQQELNESEEYNNSVDQNINSVEDLKRQYDLYMIQKDQELEQMKFMMCQLQQENANLHYQQRIQYHPPPGQQMNTPINFITNVGKPEFFHGDYKSNPDTWIDQVYEYMMLTGIDPRMYVQFAATYLRDQARVWWSSMSTEDKIKIQDFNLFKQTLLAKYRPVNQQRTARTQLKSLKQINSVAAYNNAFSNVIQLIHDMSLADKLDNYMNGLKYQIQEKLITEEFNSLSDAMNAAARIDTLLYTRRNASNFTRDNDNKINKPKHGTGQAAEVNHVQSMSTSALNYYEDNGSSPQAQITNEMQATVNAVRFTKLTPEQREQLKREGRCFKCREHGHMASSCPTNVHRNGISSSSNSMKPSAPISNSKKY